MERKTVVKKRTKKTAKASADAAKDQTLNTATNTKPEEKKEKPKAVYEFTDDGKVVISYNNYDLLIDELSSRRFARDEWWPSADDVNYYIRSNFRLCFEFVVWLVESDKKPVSDEAKKSWKQLNNLLKEKVVFIDDPDKEEEKEDTGEKDAKETQAKESKPEGRKRKKKAEKKPETK